MNQAAYIPEPAQAPLPPSRPAGRAGRVLDYWVLSKPEVNFLVVLTTLAGFCLASGSSPRIGLLAHTLIGTFLVASGTAALNEFMERDYDSRMRRTARRPLPAGRILPGQALRFGILVSILGVAYLAIAVNVLSSLLAALTLALYLLVYTPLKRRTLWAMFIGAFPGAIPPLIGWAAARRRLSFEAWVLFAIVFLWQFPHFLAIAWMYREDYRRAGYRMLPSGERASRAMAWQVVIFSLALVLASLLPTWMGRAGWAYFAGALVLGLGFFNYSARLAFAPSNSLARRLLMASTFYLPLVMGLMIVDKVRAW